MGVRCDSRVSETSGSVLEQHFFSRNADYEVFACHLIEESSDRCPNIFQIMSTF